MKISLTTQTFDLAGALLLHCGPESDLKTLTRRVSRTATLDGGCTFDDYGFSWSDATLNIKLADISEQDESALTYLVKNYSVLNASTSEGFFAVLVDSYSFKEGAAELRLLVVGSA